MHQLRWTAQAKMAVKTTTIQKREDVSGIKTGPATPSSSAINLELRTLGYTFGVDSTAPSALAPGPSNEIAYPPPPLFQNSLVSAVRAADFRRRGHVHFAALCWFMFTQGWNDGTPGPLLPIIQQTYHGYISGAFMNIWLNDRIGFGKVLVLGAAFQMVTYAIQSPGPPFPALVVANSLGGFGIALQGAQANGFVGGLKEHASTKLGFLHAFYGIGAFAAPLVATQFSNSRHWHYHYLVSLSMAVVNLAVLTWVFKFKTQDEVYAEAGQESGEAQAAATARGNKFSQILRLRTVHALAFFILVYVGAEVTLGGWIVTFIISERDGGRSAGYISSGFFGGLTVGRIALMWINRKVSMGTPTVTWDDN
ncbi:hypothetical protein HWV62_21756 [Athelia sp. TMB]|nr:hypothetical protein HWV62_21756 [Athelia sp. TMB]